MSQKSPKELIKTNPFVLAPMDDVTDIAFRSLALECGASYTTTELTSVDALIRDKVSPQRYERRGLSYNQIQLFGHNPNTFVEAAQKVECEADSFDVNFGCPSATVTGNESGSILLKDPKNVGAIVEKLVKHSEKPICAKIRLGYEKMTYLDVAKEIEDAGCELLAVHGRTAKQRYSGEANWDAIAEVHKSLSIPVVGNGDIRTVEDCDSKLHTSCDALMIGRAAIGNPFIFQEFLQYYRTGKKLSFNRKENQKKLFLNYLQKLEDEDFAHPLKIKKQAMWFMKGIEGAKELRTTLAPLKMPTKEGVLTLVEEF